jgi:hypothetical protein
MSGATGSRDPMMVLKSRESPCCSYYLPLPRQVPPARQSPCRSALRAACAYDCAYCLMMGRYRSSENIRTRVVHCIRNSPSHSQWEHDTNELVIRMRLGTSNRYTTVHYYYVCTRRKSPDAQDLTFLLHKNSTAPAYKQLQTHRIIENYKGYNLVRALQLISLLLLRYPTLPKEAVLLFLTQYISVTFSKL